jgi:hypothetical protein
MFARKFWSLFVVGLVVASLVALMLTTGTAHQKELPLAVMAVGVFLGVMELIFTNFGQGREEKSYSLRTKETTIIPPKESPMSAGFWCGFLVIGLPVILKNWRALVEIMVKHGS